MAFKIIGDSCCDYTNEAGGLPWLVRVPLTIELGGASYTDDGSIDCGKLLENMAASPSAPKTACPPPAAFMKEFETDDDVYVVTLSEKVSGTYGSALSAARLYAEETGKKNVHIFNSRSAAAGEIALCIKIRELASSGLAFEDVVLRAEQYAQELTTYFVLETLDVFRKNGRLSHIQSIVTGALRIKLIMGADRDGGIVMCGKALTVPRALSHMAGMITEKHPGGGRLVITHCNCPDRAEYVRNLLRASFDEIIVCAAGGLSTTYANSGGIIVGF